MEKFKKEMFLETFKKVMDFSDLSNNEKTLLKESIDNLLKENIENEMFFKKIIEKLINKKQFNLIETSQQFDEVLNDIDIIDEEEVYLIWKYPSDIDKIDLKYLIKHWEDIWFSPSDEVLGLFFPKSKKNVVITHYNTVYF